MPVVRGGILMLDSNPDEIGNEGDIGDADAEVDALRIIDYNETQ